MSLSTEKNDIQFVDEKPASEVEKPNQIIQIDNFHVLGLSAEDANFYLNFSEEQRKRVIHKVSTIMVD
jgi:hypothetical protein